MSQEQFTSIEDLATHVRSITDLKERADGLLFTWQDFILSHPNEMFELFEELRIEAGKKRQQHAENLATLGTGRCLRQLGRYDQAIGAYEASLGYLEAIKDNRWFGYALSQLGSALMNTGEYTEALDYYNRSYDHFESIDHKAYQASALGGISAIYGICGDYQKALHFCLRSLSLYRDANDESGEAHALLNLAQVHESLGEIEHAEESNFQALEIWRRQNKKAWEAKALHNIGELYLSQERFDEAKQLLNRALEIFEKHDHRRGVARILGSLGRLFTASHNPEHSFDYFTRAITIAREIQDADTLASLTFELGIANLMCENFRAAKGILREARSIVIPRELQSTEKDIELALAQACEGLKQYEQAYRHQRRAHELLILILGEEQRRAMAEMKTRFDLESSQREKQLYKLRNEQLEMIMEQRSKELASMALHLVEKAELIESFSKQVKKIARTASEEARALAENLLDDLDRQSVQGEWDRFEKQLDQTQGNFVQTLINTYPDLTSTEARVCSLLKIELSTKEIASLLNISERGVESHRYSVRKKFNLESNRSLVSFLRDFEGEHATRRAISEDQSFSTTLSSQFPSLSETELKICTLTRNGLTTKEIASFLGKSERTVETHRYHIRKKLGLAKGQNLRAFLTGFVSDE